MTFRELDDLDEAGFLRHILESVTAIEEASIDAGNGIGELFNVRCELAYRIGFTESRDELRRRMAV